MSSSVAIVIPIYRERLSAREYVSVHQTIKILYAYEHVLLMPAGLNTDFISNIYLKEGKAFTIEFFPEYYFRNTDTYNKLMLDKSFYQRFVQFEYMLICQTDAYIFRDDLQYWITAGFDYVGAPWIKNYWGREMAAKTTWPRRILAKLGYKKFNLVGNGGFSLRKVDSFIANLRLFGRQARKFKKNEDFFFSFYITSFNPFFRIPRQREALKFAFDQDPEDALALNGGNLPMACHGWHYYLDFWHPYIPEFHTDNYQG